jgi:hypothetical protein
MMSATSAFRIVVAAVLLLAGACGSDDEGGTDGGGAAGGGKGGSGTGGSAGSGGAGGGAGLKWYETCGEPVCRPAPGDAGAPSGTARCTTEKAGAACTTKGAMCDPGSGCGVLLRCTDSDPRMQPGGCPISRKAYKTDVHYLEGTDLAALEQQIRALRLARYRYRDAPERQRLGFMIDDVPDSPAVDEPRDMIDVYAYTSMVVATVQRQAARLDAQEREIGRLRAEVARLTARAPSRFSEGSRRARRDRSALELPGR